MENKASVLIQLQERQERCIIILQSSFNFDQKMASSATVLTCVHLWGDILRCGSRSEEEEEAFQADEALHVQSEKAVKGRTQWRGTMVARGAVPGPWYLSLACFSQYITSPTQK